MEKYFVLSSERSLLVKSVTSTTRGGKATIKVELETTDFDELSYALRCLNEVQAAQVAPKVRNKPALLALPAPEQGAC